MKRIVLSVLAAFFVLVVPASADHSFGIIWHGNPPLTLKVDVEVAGQDAQAAAFAMSNWSQSTVLDLVPASKSKLKIEYRVMIGCPNACTDYSAQNGYFSQATVVLNQAWMATLSQPVRETVLCHELGHALGLAHTNDSTSCMYPTTAGANVPNAHDYEELELAYG